VRFFVDSNVFVYSHDALTPRKQTLAVGLLRSLWSTGEGITSAQVINESVSVLARIFRGNETPAAIRERMRPYLAWTTQAVDAELIPLAWSLADRYQVSYWDSFIVAAAQRAVCDVLYSEDMKAGMSFDGGLRVVNPFAEEVIEAPTNDRYTVQETRATYQVDVKAPRGKRAPRS
jgi:predicted nucleic acid-binding protein